MNRISLLLLSLASCSIPSASGASPTAPTAPPLPPSAGDVTASAGPDRGADAIAALRAEGPAALDRLLGEYDYMPAGGAKSRLARTIDSVAGQRFATVSRLYWYTDLDAAKAEAHRTGKPILSLRMLGRLDEDLSCANSRFFRTILYANAELAPWLRDHFVLHWSSERPVPKVTIDFGDGRVLERTVTGNSAHFVLDAEGHPLDVLPGLYAPSAFRAELEKSLVLADAVATKPDQRRALVEAYHRAKLDARQAQWTKLKLESVIFGRRGLQRAGDIDDALATAERATYSKGYVEVPDLRVLDLGADPGALAPDLELWAVVGQRLYGWGDPGAATTATTAVGNGNEIGFGIARRQEPRQREAPHAPAKPLHLLDARSRTLVLALVNAPGAPALSTGDQDALLARLDQTIAADSAQNELVLRPSIDARMATSDDTFASLDAFLYEGVFHTPASDPWLGLLPRDAFIALPADGVTAR